MEEGAENTPRKYGGGTRLSAAIDPSEAKEFATVVEESRVQHLAAKDPLLERHKGLVKPHEMTDEEKVDINSMLSIATEKLTEFGISEPATLLPSTQDISLIVSRDPNLPSGETGEYGEYMRLYIHPEQLGKPFSRPVFYHELYHIIAKKNIKKRSLHQTTPGKYDAISQGISPVAYGEAVGFPFEGIAELFKLVCMEKPVGRRERLFRQYPQATIVYTTELTFVYALLREYSAREKIEPRQAINSFLKSTIEGDYSFYKDLTGVFGNSAVRSMNKIRGSKKNMIQIAKDCGFLKYFTSLGQKLGKGESVILPGFGLQIKQREPESPLSFYSEESVKNWKSIKSVPGKSSVT